MTLGPRTWIRPSVCSERLSIQMRISTPNPVSGGPRLGNRTGWWASVAAISPRPAASPARSNETTRYGRSSGQKVTASAASDSP